MAALLWGNRSQVGTARSDRKAEAIGDLVLNLSERPRKESHIGLGQPKGIDIGLN